MSEEIEAYRRQIVRLTNERDEARRERDEALAKFGTETEVLRVQIREGTSAQVEALRRMLAKVTAERDRLSSSCAALRRAS